MCHNCVPLDYLGVLTDIINILINKVGVVILPSILSYYVIFLLVTILKGVSVLCIVFSVCSIADSPVQPTLVR